MKRFSVDCGTLWVCECCMLEHANGECCPDDSHGGDGVAPWSGFDFARFAVWAGLSRDEHEDGCDPDDECGCERREFSSSSCDGCGSRLHGARFAFGMTRERQKFSTGVLPA